MKWGLAYLGYSTVVILAVLLVARRLRPDWREAALWLAVALPFVLTIVTMMPMPERILAAPLADLPPTAIAVSVPPGIENALAKAPDIDALLLTTWLAVAVMLLARDGLRMRRLLRKLARTTVQSLPGRTIASRLGVSREVIVTVSPVLPVPLAIGSGEVCLPSSLLESSEHRTLESILAHELAHLRRRDPQLQQFMHLLAVVLWWQPLNRLVARRLSAVAELRADALASTVVEPTTLASALVEFAQSVHAPQPAGMPAFRSGLLSERVDALLSDRATSSPVHVRLPVCVGLTVVALFIAPRFESIPLVLPSILQSPVVVTAERLPTASAAPARAAVSRSAIADSEPADTEVIAALKSMLRDPEQHVRVAARRSLTRIGNAESVRALHDDPFLQTDAIKEAR